MDFQNWSTTQKLVAAFLGLVMLVGLLENPAVLVVLLIIFGFLYSSTRNTEASHYTGEEITERAEPVRRDRPASSEQIHQHALRAVRRAGLNPNEVSVLPVNIGMLMYYQNNEPVIYTNRAIEDDSDYIRPFVELRVPVNATGRIRFEVFNSEGEKVFERADSYQLERGRNLIASSTRLPVHEELGLNGRWELRVSADNVVLARHIFQWEDVQGAPGPQHHVGEDGELSSEMRAVLAESRLERMSLDELLAYQEEEDEARRSG